MKNFLQNFENSAFLGRNLPIKVKMLVSFFLVAMFAGLIGVTSIMHMEVMDKRDQELYEFNTVPISLISDVSTAYQRMRISMRDILLYGNDETRQQKNIEHIKELDETIETLLSQFQGRLKTGAILDEFEVLQNTLKNYMPAREKLIQLAMSEEGHKKALFLMKREGASVAKSIDNSITKLKEFEVTQAGIKAEANSITAKDARATIIYMLIGAVSLGIIIALFATRSLTRPLIQIVQMLSDMEHGNLATRLRLNRGDELGRLGQALDGFADNLQDEILAAFNKLSKGDFTFTAQGLIREPLAKTNCALNHLMGEIRKASEQVANGAHQISGSSQAFSQGATEQASSLEGISASLNELSAQTTSNAENANQANQLSVEAQQDAQQGNNRMQSMVEAMEDINQAGQNISMIIKTIDEIANQTNLLALNAAIEAARAGQHGKGFAVVAKEVGDLATRSAKAAKETAELIESSVKKAENGSVIANQTAEMLQEIVGGVTKVSDIVSEIAVASSEQAQRIAQVNQGITQIDTVTQQNTANAEESAAAAEELSTQAEQMHQMLQRLTLQQEQATTHGTAKRILQTSTSPVSWRQ